MTCSKIIISDLTTAAAAEPDTETTSSSCEETRRDVFIYWTVLVRGVRESIPATWPGLRPPEHVRSEAVKSMIRVAARQGDWCIYSAEMWMGAAECRH